ncbi:hypothetical protein [Aliikangiella coralliicola]|uniref:Uncharacterized protein n=1 Tax=Aliikangiella coralliicola TaxID=2592383 RepID=A0A545TW98_9GAMM|nr:hypothetical protein [Aliikangiella coralliicola]TQV81497.1 hypothetical protein FLL46_25435 [Aliikangiella coralliicola]
MQEKLFKFLLHQAIPSKEIRVSSFLSVMHNIKNKSLQKGNRMRSLTKIILPFGLILSANVYAQQERHASEMEKRLEAQGVYILKKSLEVANSDEIMKVKVKLLKKYHKMLLDAGFSKEEAIRIVARSAINTQPVKKPFE